MSQIDTEPVRQEHMWSFSLCIRNVLQKFMDVWRVAAMIYHLLKCLLRPTEGNGGNVFI